MVKNPQANGILERVHQVLGQMLLTVELDMAYSVTPNDIDVFLDKPQSLCHCCLLRQESQSLAIDVSRLERYHTNVLLAHLTKVRC